MADYNLKDDLLGFGRSQIKGMLFHNTTLAALTTFTHKKGLFYYDTTLDSVEFIKDNATGWHSIINMVSSNNPTYDVDTDVMDRLAVGTKAYATIRGYNTGIAGFVTVDIDGYPYTQAKITFEDILSSDYTTVITAPGVDTRFATEKAIVDYVTTALVTPQDNILDWNTNKYIPFAAKIGSNPGYPYFYTGVTNPTFTNRLNVDGNLYATSFRSAIAGTQSRSILANQNAFFISYSDATYSYGLTISAETWGGYITNFNYNNNGDGPIVIGDKSGTGSRHLENIVIDDYNRLFNIDMTTVRLNKGTALKYLYLDASKNITYVDAPAGGVTPVDNILDWSTDAYKPYIAKTASAFYTGVTVPDAVATILNYDGIFRATQLFEGSTRVMTTHGNWTANGSLHAVTTTAHAGFCPQLPASATGLFLRDDGTWGSILWKRVGTTLSQFTANDLLDVRSNSATATITGIGTIGTGVYGTSTSASGVQGSSSSSYGVLGLSSGAAGGFFRRTEASTNSVLEVLHIQRLSNTVGASGIGGYIGFSSFSTTSAIRNTGRIINTLTTATNTAEVSSFEWWLINSGTLAKKMELTGAGELIVANGKLTGLATYADNTAATGGGLTAGQLYKTASGVLMVTY